MLAIVKNGAITATGTIKQLFPNTSFAGGVANADFKTAEGVKNVVQGEQKDQKYYFVTQGDITLVDGVPTQQYSNIAKRLENEDAKDADGNQLYVQVWDEDKKQMVDSSEKLVNQGVKTHCLGEIKQTANKLLAKTDWMVIRKYERDVAIPSATATYRAAVITECARLETAIGNAADVDALATVMAGQNWPTED
jgi:hypothetical protein